MSQLKKIGLTSTVVLLAILLYSFIRTGGMDSLTMINTSFYIGLFFLVIGAFISTLQSGFFDFFQKTMKKKLAQLRNQQTPTYIPYSKIFQKKPFYWFSVGVIFIFLSVALLLLTT